MHTRHLDDPIDPALIDTSVQIYRASDGGVDVLREFAASVEYDTDEESVEIGSMKGWIGWSIADEDIQDCADAISADAEMLGSVAAEIAKTYEDRYLSSVLLLDRMWLEPEYRGNRLSGAAVEDLLSLLGFEVDDAIVVLQPEPQLTEGGPMDHGPERDKAMERLHAAYRESGFAPWDGSVVWWLPIS